MDREKVIKGLELLKDFISDGLPGKRVVFNSYINIVNDAIALMKEQEAVEPGKEDDGNPEPCTAWWYVCGSCGQPIDKMDRYCRMCGREVAWE